jgi:hypothetical protein
MSSSWIVERLFSNVLRRKLDDHKGRLLAFLPDQPGAARVQPKIDELKIEGQQILMTEQSLRKGQLRRLQTK